jgi:hypothetical protein
VADVPGLEEAVVRVAGGEVGEWLLPVVPVVVAAITATTTANAAIRPRACARRRRVARRRASRRARSVSGSIGLAAASAVAQRLHLGAEDNRCVG